MFYHLRKQNSFKRILATIAIIASAQLNAHSQATIKGNITDKNQQLLANASVALLQASDSSLVKGSISSAEGRFSFEKIPIGNYLVVGSFTGYRPVYTPVNVKGNSESIELPMIRLSEEEKLLTDVTVIARKPLFEQKTDRMVINVAGSITHAGSTALDVLERSPGVMVDRQNNALAVNGKNGVVIMINGKISRIPMAGLMQLLADMNSDNIERIEIITTPPANFDAEGNAGYINIVLKSNTFFGTNGSYSLTAGYSKYEMTNGSININHRKHGLNIYGDYTFSRDDKLQYVSFYHKVNNQGKQVENYSTSKRRPLVRTHSLTTGVDLELNKKTIIGGLFSLYDRNWKMNAWNKGTVYIDHQPDTLTDIFNYELHTLANYNANINLQHQYKEGQKLSINFDYIYYKDVNPVDYVNSFSRGDGSFINKQEVKSNKVTPISFWVGSADYTKKLNKKTDIEAGVKGTLSRFNNNVLIERLEPGGWTKDPELTNNYDLKEDITAAYFTMNILPSEKISVKMGLRYEYTNSILNSAMQKNIVDRHYGNLFPSLFFNYKINDDNAANFSYSRRITRPTFNDMAPFVIFIDPNTYFSGNPGLQPAITDAVSGAYTFKRKILTMSYSYDANPITNFSPKVDPQTNKLTLAAENQKNNKTFTISISLPFEITKWWSSQNNIQGLSQQLNGLYNKENFRLSRKNYSINSTNTFRLPKEISFSVSAFYFSSGMFGIYYVNPLGSLDIGAQKKWTRSSLRINAGNILNSMVFKPTVNLPEKNLVTQGKIIFGYSNIRVTYTHSFGNAKLKQKRQRTTAEEEKRRVQ